MARNFLSNWCFLSLLIHVPNLNASTNFETKFGRCPKYVVGKLFFQISEKFEKTKSLLEVKKLITKENLEKKYFLSNYELKTNLTKSKLWIEFECPRPLFQVIVNNPNLDKSNELVLVSNGQLFDPTYIQFIQDEKEESIYLPYLSIPESTVDKKMMDSIVQLMKSNNKQVNKLIAEIIINNAREMKLILKLNNKSSVVYFGKNEWPGKMAKLERVLLHYKNSSSFPIKINMAINKKVVVKF